MESSKEAAATKGSDLEEPHELGPEVASFLRGSTGTSKDEDDRMPPEPAVTEFSEWYCGGLIGANPLAHG